MGYTREELYDALRRVELGPSPTLFVVTELSKLGPLAGPETREEKLQILGQALRDMVGPEGTLTVPTWNYDGVNMDYTYDHDNSPSRAGILTEHIRQLPGAIRSLHPFESYTSLGPQAEYICGQVSKHDFGPNSVFDHLLQLDATALIIGIHPSLALTLNHHAEFVMGAPYRYHKEFPIAVTSGGKEFQDRFYLTVRFIDSEIQQDNHRCLPEVNQEFIVFRIFQEMGYTMGKILLGDGHLYFYRMREMFAALVELFSRDLYGLLVRPPETRAYTKTI